MTGRRETHSDPAPRNSNDGGMNPPDRKPQMELSQNFWKAHQGLVLVGLDGSLRFTRAGRTKFAPRLAKYGYALANVKTYERFSEVMSHVNAGELEANNREFERLLASPGTSVEEREMIRAILGTDGPQAVSRNA